VRPVAALSVAAVLAVSLAACGGGGRLSKSEYETKMSALGRDAASQLRSIRTEDFEKVPAYFRELSARLRGVAKEAKAIEPPRDVADVHARIVDAFEKEAAITTGFAGRLRGADVARVKVLLRQFDSAGLRAALQELDAAGRTLVARGYRISSSAGT
jgi:hypothetical protein